MKNEILHDPSKIHILDFRIISGEINSPFEFDPDVITGYSFDVDYDMSFNLVENLVKADFKVDVMALNEHNIETNAKGSFNFVFIFKIENLDQLTETTEENHVTPDSWLASSLAAITFSTSRGILMTRFQGTALRGFILPVVDPNILLIKT